MCVPLRIRRCQTSAKKPLGKLGGWIGLRRLDLDFFLNNNMIDQSEAWVGCKCILNAINPNASKKPHTYCHMYIPVRPCFAMEPHLLLFRRGCRIPNQD
jgi:hypothetical protein